MKWRANSQSLKPRHYEIHLDHTVGFYLYVFEDGKYIRDYLQDTLELAIESALEHFGVPKESWKKVDNQIYYACPCCGFLTRSEPHYGTFEICPVCNWEDDYVQYNDPNYEGGANLESLNEARENYKEFGASSKNSIKSVRGPLPDEIP